MATAVSAAEMAMENGKEPIDACEEHDSRNYQIIFHVYHNSYLLRAINNPPTIHANNKMLTASKGSR